MNPRPQSRGTTPTTPCTTTTRPPQRCPVHTQRRPATNERQVPKGDNDTHETLTWHTHLVCHIDDDFHNVTTHDQHTQTTRKPPPRRGLYCPPLILAGIRRNPGNSRNSIGIKFGRWTCQIDSMIPTEFRMEFKFRRNGSRNHPEGINSWNSTERNPVPLSHAQIDRRCLPTINLGMVNNAKPYSLTTTIIHIAHPASPPRYCCLRPPPPPIVTSRPQQPQHTSTQQEPDENAMSLLKNNATTPRHWMNGRPPGATSPTAMWQPDDERRRRSSSLNPAKSPFFPHLF